METNAPLKTIDINKLVEDYSYFLKNIVFTENSLQPEPSPDYSKKIVELAVPVACELRPDDLDRQKIEELVFASVFLDELSLKSSDEREETELCDLYDLADTLDIGYEELISIFKDYETQSSLEAKYVKIMLDVTVIMAHIENVIDAAELNQDAHIRTLGIKKFIGVERHFERRAQYSGIDQDRYSDNLPEIVQLRSNLVNLLASLVNDLEIN